jgi:acyl carrier protein
MSDIASKVKAIIVDKRVLTKAKFHRSKLTNDLGADSLDTVELIMDSKRNSIWQYLMIRLKKSAQ